MSRFFVRPDQIDEEHGIVRLESGDSHHVSQVLKMRAGETIWALRGDGLEFEAKLFEVGKRQCLAKITARRRLETEAQVPVTIAQAIPKSLEKLEWVLQHGTEVGASGFIVFESERGRSLSERFTTKISRWQEIVRSAAEQSHRAVMPVVEGVLSYQDVLARTANFDTVLLAYEGERTTRLRDALPKSPASRILALIGPEAGFSEAEVLLAGEAGAIPITLGPRILRTETAALVLLSQIVCLAEEQ
jgi:16S rRNA (uracil1498-N3)-methyltransferase